jgi:hypothetical protein
MKDMAVTLEFSEILKFTGNNVLRQAAEIAQDLQLQLLRHPREFRRARRREYNLKGAHQVRPFKSNLSGPNSATLITLSWCLELKRLEAEKS